MKKDLVYRSPDSNGQTGNRLANPPPEEPDALIAHVRDCGGDGPKGPSLPAKHVSKVLGIFAGLLLLIGCASMQVNSRLQEYKSKLDPMLGKATKDDIVAMFGMPSRTAQLGNSEAWEYHRSFGVRGGANAYTPNPRNPYGVNTYASGQSHEVYDQLTLTFDQNGVFQNWQAYVQR